ncbi:MAG: DUF1707 domain-containing protein [Pseudonocardiaceae bacterium]|nr:MAG: DUF1707 domain-containing protein [Pseudonocardiaceae bacterium]
MTTLPQHPTRPVRIGDADRERATERIRTALSEGRLTLEEADERQTAAYAARFESELVELTADLPVPPPPPAPPLSKQARTRLGVHAIVVAALATMLIIGWATSAAPFFWPAWPMFWLALSLFLHARIARRREARTTSAR